MRTRWQELWRLDRRVRGMLAIGALTIVIIVSVVASQMIGGQSLEKQPARGAAIEVHALLELTKQLTTNDSQAKPADATHEYLDRLRAIQQSCQRINQYQRAGQATGKTAKSKAAEDLLRLNQSQALCQDLSRLARNSETVYRTTEPLLAASTHPRRYQSLGIFSSQIRQRHLNATTTAITTLKKRKNTEADFPTTVPAALQKLQVAIKNSRGLAYMPALRSFQLSVLGERQQYWGPYAGAESLNKSLQIQFTTYCQSFKKADSSLKQCAESKT